MGEGGNDRWLLLFSGDACSFHELGRYQPCHALPISLRTFANILTTWGQTFHHHSQQLVLHNTYLPARLFCSPLPCRTFFSA